MTMDEGAGSYQVRGVSRDLHRAARARAAREGVTLRSVLLHAFREYAAGTWTPHPDETRPGVRPVRRGPLPRVF